MQSTSQSYISDELTHFVGRGKSTEDQLQLLIHIIRGERIMHPPFNPRMEGNINVDLSAKFSDNEKMFVPQIICFADIPFDSLRIHTRKYSRFGMSFSKDFVAKNGGSPIRYIPLNSRSSKLKENISREELHDSFHNNKPFSPWENYPQASYFDEMINEYHELIRKMDQFSNDRTIRKFIPGMDRKIIKVKMFLASNVFSYIKFFDHALPDEHEENYYFEREWRIVGHLPFKLSDIQHVFIPSEFISVFMQQIPELEEKILTLDYD